jgi:hypothetical protein
MLRFSFFCSSLFSEGVISWQDIWEINFTSRAGPGFLCRRQRFRCFHTITCYVKKSGNVCLQENLRQNILWENGVSSYWHFITTRHQATRLIWYKCKTWTFTLTRKEHRLRMFVKIVLRRILGPKNLQVKKNEETFIMRSFKFYVFHQMVLR